MASRRAHRRLGTKHGVRCRVFSGSTYANAAPLRNGKQFCRSHATRYVRCAGMTAIGAWCSVSSRSLHAGADPLREGGIFCAKHTLPPAKHCASCGDTETALWPDMGTEAHYFKRFRCYERHHYCRVCWHAWDEWPQLTDSAAVCLTCDTDGPDASDATSALAAPPAES